MQRIFPSPLNDILHTLWSNKMDLATGKCYTSNILKPSRVCFTVNISTTRGLYKINGMLTLHIPSLKPLHPLATSIIVVCHNHSVSLIKWTTATFFSKCHSLPDGYFPLPPNHNPNCDDLGHSYNHFSASLKWMLFQNGQYFALSTNTPRKWPFSIKIV